MNGEMPQYCPWQAADAKAPTDVSGHCHAAAPSH